MWLTNWINVLICYQRICSTRASIYLSNNITHNFVQTSLQGNFHITNCIKQIPSWNGDSNLVGKEFPTFHIDQRFITMITAAYHQSLSWAIRIQSTSFHFISSRPILIFYTYLHLGLPSGPLPSDSPTRTVYTIFISNIQATCHANAILLDFSITVISAEKYKCLIM